MNRDTTHLSWVIEKMPVASQVALDRFTTLNPHWKGAGWDDCLDALLDSDSHLELTEPLYEASKDTPYSGMLVESVGLTMLYSSQNFAASKLADQIKQVLQTVASLS